jgi:hypothetical protein
MMLYRVLIIAHPKSHYDVNYCIYMTYDLYIVKSVRICVGAHLGRHLIDGC